MVPFGLVLLHIRFEDWISCKTNPTLA